MKIHRLVVVTICSLAIFLTAAVLMLPLAGTALGQQPSALEADKLALEVEKLRSDLASDWLKWGVPLITLFLGLASAAGTFLVARWTRANSLDQATHEKRLECYPKLVQATKRFALYFPEGGQFSPGDCTIMGHEMSNWYFKEGGILMSTKARDAYFKLARALTRASRAKALCFPKIPDDAEHISAELGKRYRQLLCMPRSIGIEYINDWKFGSPQPQMGHGISERVLHQDFKDYILLQFLSSDLRTELSGDLKSRRRPS